jgi:hypothetical protein
MELENIIGTINKNYIVQLLTNNCNGDMYSICLPIVELIKDWWSELPQYSPENDAMVWSVSFYSNGICFPLLQRRMTTFEDLMEVLNKL